jgi:AAA+ ATPase superfamily predicted ATPase
MPNPFFYGGRITNPANFIGRTKELQTIFSALETANSGQLQHVQVVGPRRIGKSSLLYHVTQIYKQRLTQPEKYRIVYVDLDDAHCHTLEGLLKYILSQLDISSKPTLAKFQEAIEELNHTQGIYPVLCLDEFEHLSRRREQFPNEVFEAWRSLASASELAFVTASQMSIGQLIQQGNLTSTFHNIFIYLELGNFTEPEARTLLARNTDRPFAEEEINKLFKLAGHHPAHLQIASQLLYDAKADQTVNWTEVKTEYERRLNQIKPFEPVANHSSLLNRLWFLILGFIKSIGRAILETRKAKDEISESSALWWGIVAILILLLLVFGWIPLGWLFKLGAKWLGG